jgi:hypothetical protein
VRIADPKNKNFCACHHMASKQPTLKSITLSGFASSFVTSASFINTLGHLHVQLLLFLGAGAAPSPAPAAAPAKGGRGEE